MKKIFTLLALAACCAAMTWGCSDDKYDDTEIRQEIENLKQEIASMKEQVNSLKTIIDALNENKFITNYTEAADGSCTITFNDGKTIRLSPASANGWGAKSGSTDTLWKRSHPSNWPPPSASSPRNGSAFPTCGAKMS